MSNTTWITINHIHLDTSKKETYRLLQESETIMDEIEDKLN